MKPRAPTTIPAISPASRSKAPPILTSTAEEIGGADVICDSVVVVRDVMMGAPVDVSRDVKGGAVTPKV